MDTQVAKFEAGLDENQIMQEIAATIHAEQDQAAKDQLNFLFESASQPRHASGNACVKLCYYIEQCRKSTSKNLRELAFSQGTCLELFKFYIEWNEKNQHRSMRQVIELLASLITLNVDNSASSIIKNELLENVLSIVTHQSAQPFVKPALKVLECFLNKSTVSLKELAEVYNGNAFAPSRNKIESNSPTAGDPGSWHSFISAIFEWMSLPDTAPAAGKLLVTLFQKFRLESVGCGPLNRVAYTILWQQWIKHGLTRHPDSLENIKNYLFPALFKLDRNGSLEFLQDLVRESSFKDLERQETNAQAFLLLSATEVGKKSGLVDDASNTLRKDPSAVKTQKSIKMPELSIGILLGHKAGNVRSAAFSVLISSISSTRPLSKETFNLLRQYLGLLHSDTDAKVRNEVLSNIKHMVGRIKGAISFLTREVASGLIKHNRLLQKSSSSGNSSVGNAGNQQAMTLQEHKNFVSWYQNFLVNELIPTASYQRHITALRAVHIILHSGILMPPDEADLKDLLGSESRGLQEKLFTKKMMRLLIDLLMDPFEDVRATANQLLKLAPKTSYRNQEFTGTSILHYQVFPSLSNNTSKEASNIATDMVPIDTSISKLSEQATVPEALGLFVQRTEIASRRTGRADLADGVARSHELLYYFQATDEARLNLVENLVTDLEGKIDIAEHDLAQAVHLAPVHGNFAALRLVWESLGQSYSNGTLSASHTFGSNHLSLTISKDLNSWIDLQHRILKCCVRIWLAVKEVLCNDSPEGHLLQDLEDMDTISTKDILSYSFRATHESSNLLRAMVNKLKSKFADGPPIVPYEVFYAAGTLSFEQLSNLRHRGAFSTVSLTFAKCCQLTQAGAYSDGRGESLLEEWYKGTLMCIYEQSSTTRRSAGIPALMTGILSANSSSPAFQEVMAQLKILARNPAACTAIDETNIPQVHAMNCLKEIFKSSSLGKRCESYIADCLQIAAESLKSETWAIRNCGLLLLRSLIDCLFGTSESKKVMEAGWDGKSTRLAYERYPELPGILLGLIIAQNKQFNPGEYPQIGAVESVFPALDIIRRAGPPQNLRQEIYTCIKFHLSSSIWHIRDIAARTICTLLLDEAWIEKLSELYETCSASCNEVHGILLVTRYLLERKLDLDPLASSEGLSILRPFLDRFWTQAFSKSADPVIEAAYIEVMVVANKIGILTSTLLMSTNPENDMFTRAVKLACPGHNLSPKIEATPDREPHFPENSHSLLMRAIAIGALYTAVKSKQISRLRGLIISVIQFDIDIACDVLDHMSTLWGPKTSRPEDLASLINVYIGAYVSTTSCEFRNIALRNLADVLEHLLPCGWLKQSKMTSNSFSGIELSIPVRGNPNLANAEIRISGSLLALDFLNHIEQGSIEELSDQIQAWGMMLQDNGSSDNDFDTRYAAAGALKAFYSACRTEIITAYKISSLLSSLLALYDFLNDDDDEIRELAASVVSQILGSNQAPLAASGKLLDWLYRTFGRTEPFRSVVVSRITCFNGQLIDEFASPEAQLTAALKVDDSLFAEEEQNLYIDEVREAIAWTSLLLDSEMLLSDKQTIFISSWALEGIMTLTSLAETEDGPFGWASKPKVFTISMKIILAAKAMITNYNQNQKMKVAGSRPQDERINWGRLPDAVQRLLEVGSRTSLHPVLLDGLVAEFEGALPRQKYMTT